MLCTNNNKVHLYLTSAIFQSIDSKLKSLSIEALTILFILWLNLRQAHEDLAALLAALAAFFKMGRGRTGCCKALCCCEKKSSIRIPTRTMWQNNAKLVGNPWAAKSCDGFNNASNFNKISLFCINSTKILNYW